MADITTVWNVQAAQGDWVEELGALEFGAIVFIGAGPITFQNPTGGLQEGDDLATAVLISLFTDRLAASSDIITDGSGDRRGWWGDLGETYPIGSRLWLLRRAKQVPQTLQDAQGYCIEALAWMIADGVAAKVDVVASFIGQGALGILVTLYDQAGQVIASYQWAWKGLS